MSTEARVVFEGVAPFAATGVLFGLLYNTLYYPPTVPEYLEAGTIGLVLGMAVGVAEQTALEQWLRRRPLLLGMVVRTVLYAVAVAVVLSLVLSIEPAMLGGCSYGLCVGAYLTGPLFLRDLVFSMAFLFVAVFIAQVVLLVGTRNFTRLLLGKYRRPHTVYAVFMFVDIRGSTTLAERLGHERYSAFLRDFFDDVSGAIHQGKGEVYQYVGDEVVLVWPGRRRAPQWLACFEAMQAAIHTATPVYEARYSVAPTFKAGVHAGPVVVTEVGTLQRAFVYHGDVLNATSRIQANCNKTGFDLLASEAVVSEMTPAEVGRFEQVGALPLRGKSEALVLYGLHT